jgi:hypothetical protein
MTGGCGYRWGVPEFKNIKKPFKKTKAFIHDTSQLSMSLRPNT